MSKIIEVAGKDFIIGEIYQDIESEGAFTPIQLKLIKKSERQCFFEQVSEGGEDVYHKNKDGLIEFNIGTTMYKKLT